MNGECVLVVYLNASMACQLTHCCWQQAGTMRSGMNCVLLSAVASSIIYITDTLLLWKSLQVNEEASHFKDKKEASVWCIHVATSCNNASSRMNDFFIQNAWLLFVLHCPYRLLIMPAFSRLKMPFWKNCFVWLHIEICFPCNVKYRLLN